MWIIGCDFHPSFQVVAIFDNQTGAIEVKRLCHREEAERFYRGAVPAGSVVGLEACGFTQWFETLLQEVGMEMWMGDAAKIRASVVRAQKTDRRDAEQFGARCTAVTGASAQAGAGAHPAEEPVAGGSVEPGMRKQRQLWTAKGRAEFEALSLLPYADRRRRELLEMLEGLNGQIEELNRAGTAEAEKRADAVYLMQQPGVGWQTALGMVLTLGPVERFPSAKHVASYLGLIPREHSSGGKQKLGAISKQGSRFMRFLLVEAGQSVAKHDAEMKQDYLRWTMRCGRGKAKVAVARKLAVKLYWMLRERKQATQC
jgi:transposase